MQTLIADIRTDLDSFHEVEAFALMTSGYRMAETGFAQGIHGFPKVPPISPDWRFLSIEELMKRSVGSEKAFGKLKKLLSASGSNALKVWRLVRWLRSTGYVLVAALVIGFLALAFFGPRVELLTLRTAAVALLAAAIAALIGKWPVMAFRYGVTIRRYLAGVALCLAGWFIGGIHLWLFDRLYLRLGRADRLMRMLAKR